MRRAPPRKSRQGALTVRARFPAGAHAQCWGVSLPSYCKVKRKPCVRDPEAFSCCQHGMPSQLLMANPVQHKGGREAPAAGPVAWHDGLFIFFGPAQAATILSAPLLGPKAQHLVKNLDSGVFANSTRLPSASSTCGRWLEPWTAETGHSATHRRTHLTLGFLTAAFRGKKHAFKRKVKYVAFYEKGNCRVSLGSAGPAARGSRRFQSACSALLRRPGRETARRRGAVGVGIFPGVGSWRCECHRDCAGKTPSSLVVLG